MFETFSVPSFYIAI